MIIRRMGLVMLCPFVRTAHQHVRQSTDAAPVYARTDQPEDRPTDYPSTERNIISYRGKPISSHSFDECGGRRASPTAWPASCRSSARSLGGIRNVTDPPQGLAR